MPVVAASSAIVAGLPTALVAHQGGWDEFLWVAAPILAVFGLLRLAGTRARRIEAERSGRDADPGVSRSD